MTKSDDTAVSTTDLDLFGQPVVPIRDRRGRPSYRKDRENQLLVTTLVAAGWTQARIARYLGCDEKTLRKHFSRELDDGCDQLEAMALQVLVKRMCEGHAPSVNRILEVIDEKGRPAPPAPKAEPRAEKLGKKQQAMEDAQDAHTSTGWEGLLTH